MSEAALDFDEISRRYDEEVRQKENHVRRYEIARVVAHALISRGAVVTGLLSQDIARRAVEFADLLIAELQRPTVDDTDDTGKEPG